MFSVVKLLIFLQLLFLLSNSYLVHQRIGRRGGYLEAKLVQRSDFNALIEKCRKTGVYTPAVEAASAWLQGDKLTSSGLTAVIQIFGLASMVEDAIGVLDHAKSKGIELNHYHFNACINACKSHKRYELGMKVFERMKDERVDPTVQTISIVISLLGLLGDWGKAYELFCSVSPSNRDSKLCTSILSSLDKSGQADLSLTVWQEMKTTGLCTSQALNTVHCILLNTVFPPT